MYEKEPLQIASYVHATMQNFIEHSVKKKTHYLTLLQVLTCFVVIIYRG
jgi:hypothetical protein